MNTDPLEIIYRTRMFIQYPKRLENIKYINMKNNKKNIYQNMQCKINETNK